MVKKAQILVIMIIMVQVVYLRLIVFQVSGWNTDIELLLSIMDEGDFEGI